MLLAGVDEAGRGCLAGPVFAAAVILPASLDLPRGVVIRDSKRMTVAQRNRARAFIEERALAWGVGSADVECIDKDNIMRATHHAMHAALDAMVDKLVKPTDNSQPPDLSGLHIKVDGDRFRPYTCSGGIGIVPHECVIRGDSSVPAIAAASVLAKTHRDEHVLERMHPPHPEFEWNKNKGYGTARHIAAIREHGALPGMHRMSFAPCRNHINAEAHGSRA